jgi:hypothetical protein
MHNKMILPIVASILAAASLASAAGWIQKAPMANDAWGLLAASDGADKIYAFGGWNFTTGDTYLTAQVYSLAANTWTGLRDLPENVSDGKAIFMNDNKIYLFNWYTESISPVTKNHVYDIVADSYSEFSVLPGFSSEYTNYAFSAELIGGLVYLCGGADGTNAGDQCWKYDPVADSYTEIAPITTPRFFHGSATVNGLMYIAGGIADYASTELSSVEVYDPESDSWSAGAPIPVTWWGGVCVNVNDTVFVAQGQSGGEIFSGGYVYVPAGDAWTEIAGDASPATMRQAGVVLGGLPWSLGGGKQGFYGIETTNLNACYVSGVTTTSTTPATTTTIPGDDDLTDDDLTDDDGSDDDAADDDAADDDETDDIADDDTGAAGDDAGDDDTLPAGDDMGIYSGQVHEFGSGAKGCGGS